MTAFSASESSIDKLEGKIRARAKQTQKAADLKGSRTEYNGSVFEEEIRQIGANYRTRQTIISRAVEHKTIGQYLEKRIHR
ncbi:phycobiliprotein lyase [Microcoleus vaginatus]|uniref:phycobiliprotein lyase n=1 Tax=Microcoleus vaginatus TaxID=119532 RepID=UPI001F60ABAE